MTNTAAIRLSRTEQLYSLTIQLPRPLLRLGRRDRNPPTPMRKTPERLCWEAQASPATELRTSPWEIMTK